MSPCFPKRRYIMSFKSFFLGFFFCIYYLSFAYINVYPLSFDQRIDNMGGVKDFVLTNTTNKVVKYQVNIVKDEVNSFDMTPWTEIYPRVLTLKPGAKGEIKMYTRAPKGTALGEYSTILNIKELEVPKDKKDKKSINVFTNLKIKLYGYVGKLDSSISLNNFKVLKGKNFNSIKLSGVLKNESLRRVNLEVVLADSNGKNGILICETKLKKDEEIDLSNLNIFKRNDIANKKYEKLDYIYIYEKGVGKFLKKEKIGS